MADEAPQLGKEALACILMEAMFAAKNVRAQRDRLLQLRRRLQQQQRSPAVLLREVAAGLHKVYSEGLRYGSSYLTSGLTVTAEHGARASFSISAFAVIPDEQLYGVLLAQWHPPRPTTQAEAFCRIESAFYAVKLAEEHHVPLCVQLLGGAPHPCVTTGKTAKRRRGMVGYADDPVTAANEHLVKQFEARSSTESDSDEDEPPHTASSSVDLDQALSYLHRASSLTSLAVKHIDVAVAFISSFVDPEEVADSSEWADEHAYISQDGPYPPDDSE